MGNCFGSEETDVEAVKAVAHHAHARERHARPSREGRILEAPNLRIFTFAELKAATRNFKSDTLLGEGGFGRVHKGWGDEKTMSPARSGARMPVAVKKLNPESLQGVQEWQVNFLGRLIHPNLVRLLGYCWEDKELLLVGAQRAAQLTLRCLAAEHTNRPSMKEVVAVLQEVEHMSRGCFVGSASPRPNNARSGHDPETGADAAEYDYVTDDPSSYAGAQEPDATVDDDSYYTRGAYYYVQPADDDQE
uniref:non-specific serine/threonine protein kinase n=1 Tax=Aegilops tauschii TaxID=37682 RepID=M8D8V8_AEGTA